MGLAAEQLIRALEAEPDNDIRICGIFDDRQDERSPSMVAGYPKLGTVAELVEFGRMARVDLLIVALPITAENRLLQLLKQLWVLPVDIRLSAHTNKLRFRPRTYSFVGKVPFLDVVDKPIADWDVVAKWLVDRVAGSLLLLLALPVMLLVALAIKLDSKGPVLFKQRRYGFNNELIEVYKFRSMYVDQSDAAASKLVTRDDPRVTPVGRFIRKTSLDELPQLINVVFGGNLSLVGPRPHAVQAKAENRLYDEVVDGYFARHRVKPGITGWAQINGWRGETDTREKIQHRVEHDLYYIENWSVFFDLQIILHDADPAARDGECILSAGGDRRGLGAAALELGRRTQDRRRGARRHRLSRRVRDRRAGALRAHPPPADRGLGRLRPPPQPALRADGGAPAPLSGGRLPGTDPAPRSGQPVSSMWRRRHSSPRPRSSSPRSSRKHRSGGF